jgi:hypothetical protein
MAGSRSGRNPESRWLYMVCSKCVDHENQGHEKCPVCGHRLTACSRARHRIVRVVLALGSRWSQPVRLLRPADQCHRVRGAVLGERLADAYMVSLATSGVERWANETMRLPRMP